jgi:hypothetical protein
VSFPGQNPAIKNFSVTLLHEQNWQYCWITKHVLKGHSQQDKRITDKQWSLGYLHVWSSPANVKISDGRCQLQQHLRSEFSGSYSTDSCTSTTLTSQQNRGSVGKETTTIGEREAKQPEQGSVGLNNQNRGAWG